MKELKPYQKQIYDMLMSGKKIVINPYPPRYNKSLYPRMIKEFYEKFAHKEKSLIVLMDSEPKDKP